jgi:hypothetical protein
MGFKPFGKNLRNSLKFYLHLTFKNMNLYLLTCIQEIGVPLQVVNRTWFKHTKGFELEFEFKPRYNVDYIVKVL